MHIPTTIILIMISIIIPHTTFITSHYNSECSHCNYTIIMISTISACSFLSCTTQ